MSQIKNSKAMKEAVKSILISKGFELITDISQIGNGDFYAIEKPKYVTVYNRKATNDYILLIKNRKNLIRVEIKWQQSSGSVDQKFPYYFLNAQNTPSDEDYVIILDGNGYSKDAKEWLLNKSKDFSLHNSKKIKVFDLSQFIEFVNKVTGNEVYNV